MSAQCWGEREGTRPSLSIVIPAFNERDRLGVTLDDLGDRLAGSGRACEVIVVDDGSADTTGLIAQSRLPGLVGGRTISASLLTHEQNMGKGAAVRTGLGASRGTWSLFMDADNSVDVGQVEALLDACRRDGTRVAIGSRRVEGARVEAVAARRLTGWVFRMGLRGLGMDLARDTQCGFKLYHHSVRSMLVQRAVEDGFAFDLEHLALLAHAGEGWSEVPVSWTHAPGSCIRPVRDGVGMLVRAHGIARRVGRVPRGELKLDHPPTVRVKPIRITRGTASTEQR